MASLDISQPEVWDDSALVDSWNDAFEEYKKYHSLAAKGEKVDVTTLRLESSHTNGEAKLEEPAKPQTTAAPPQPASSAQAHADAPSLAQASITNAQGAPVSTGAATLSIPQALMATVYNDDMKNLMMSWYYAGYYTGLYEGKQQGYAMAQDQRHTG
ncbi:uncharacterized protein LTR77_010388 [Saxophila tyrrhenica]|uniref:Survival Motor Neuron Gemin2-binding domain-containing protein n=1 Tax=Saxophila tyrrhenica TaxID=1690608 RepID=A0AAV9NVA5_9PEZI|nr:hypothetical protein LTR77_010388 [Saxophila tyrrhenica]